ncbi:MAG TPA: hypothetical protein VMH50_09145 [Thermoleophilia bacterium]|nr:hypothetical protein [Thermoleophilia bacterium]
MRDRDGLTRPMLRRVAQRLTASRQAPLRRLGAAYLRGDPPGADEPGPAGALVTGALEGIQGEVIDVDPRTVVEDGEAPVV